MFERMTERARQVIVQAQDAARTGGFDQIGSEHILLGLMREEEGLAARILLHEFMLTLEDVRDAIGGTHGVELVTGQLPFTPTGKRVLDMALREALSLGHNYIGTEHILLGLARLPGSTGMGILATFDVTPEDVREEVICQLRGPVAKVIHDTLGDSRRKRIASADDEAMSEQVAQLAKAFERGVEHADSELTLNEYQHEAHATAVYPVNIGVLYVAMKLAGEAGEVAEKVGKYLRDGTLRIIPVIDDTNNATLISEVVIAEDDVNEVRDALCKELGDVLWYVQECAGILGFDLEEVGLANLNKLASRQERGVLVGEGDNR